MTGRYSKQVAITPDTKDWTWTLERPCPECGFDATRVSRANIAVAIRESGEAWGDILQTGNVCERPREDRWSTLEYGCHVRDVYRIFDDRLGAMLVSDNPEFDSWDQDEAAAVGNYSTQEPLSVARELLEAAQRYSEHFAEVSGAQWSRPGRRSNGSYFTVESLGIYSLHDLVHHLWDVRGDQSSVPALR